MSFAMTFSPSPYPKPPRQLHDPDYVRPVDTRYVDPLEVIWLATATRLGLTIRRDPNVFSMTDGTGMLWFSTKEHLDEDDNLGQMLFHELCHWVTSGVESFAQRDWGFPTDDVTLPLEHATLRLQAWWSGRHGLRAWMYPTGGYRQYAERIPHDPTQPLDDSPWEAEVRALTLRAIERAHAPPFWEPINTALQATAALHGVLSPFMKDYRSEHEGDTLPLHWALTAHPPER